MARRGLGRGLDALIPDRTEDNPSENEKKSNLGKTAGKKTADSRVKPKKSTNGVETASKPAESRKRTSGKEEKQAASSAKIPDKKNGSIQDGVVSMRISLVEPNRSQPRKYFDEAAIDELADSIRQFGVIQPLIVQKKDGYYEIIAGERRWRAAQKAGLKEVPVIVRHFSNQEAVEVALIENIQREDLNPMEEARAYERLVKEYGLSQEDVAGRLSRSRSAITNSMRLLRLDDTVQKMVETSQISEGHARALLGLASAKEQKKAAEQIVNGHLSVRQTEKLVREANKPAAPKKESSRESDLLLRGLAENMTTSLGTKVSIRPTGKTRGRIEIEYYSAEELDRIYEMLLAAR